MARILIVDDEPLILKVLADLLGRAGHQCSKAGSAEEAWISLRQASFDMLLTDVNMPGQSGLDLARQAREEDPDLALVIVTAVDDHEVARTAVDIGAYGYLTKPLDRNAVAFTISNALRRRELEIQNRHHQQGLERTVAERTRKLTEAVELLLLSEASLREAQEETIHRLSQAAEFRDNETARHLERMSRYCQLLALRTGVEPERAEDIRLASILHDLGKLGIPDAILLKPGRLTREEFELMKDHAAIGYRILAGSKAELLQLGAVIARSHHEKVDGSGYPAGLVGEAIPVEGRIAAVADVFDALTSKRVYKDAMPVEQAIQIMQEGRGSHFDAGLLDRFLAAMDDVQAIREAFPDTEAQV
jgi:putative two-component system response regulator